MEEKRRFNDGIKGRLGIMVLLSVLLAGCAVRGDVENVRAVASPAADVSEADYVRALETLEMIQ